MDLNFPFAEGWAEPPGVKIDFPCPKALRLLFSILGREVVAYPMDPTSSLSHRAMRMTLY
jgi:hypothetical protein